MSIAIEDSEIASFGLDQIVLNVRSLMKLSDKRFFEFWSGQP